MSSKDNQKEDRSGLRLSPVDYQSMDKNDKKILDQWNETEKRKEKDERNARLMANFEEERNPSRTWLHRFFLVVSLATGVVALLMGLGQVIGMVFEKVGPIQYVLRIYIIALCLLAVLVELEWTKYVNDSWILSFWVTRGLFYGFIGVVGLEENESASARYPDRHESVISLAFIKIIALLMVACGLVYVAMGVLCLQLVSNRLRRDYQQRRERAAHLGESIDRLVENPGLVV